MIKFTSTRFHNIEVFARGAYAGHIEVSGRTVAFFDTVYKVNAQGYMQPRYRVYVLELETTQGTDGKFYTKEVQKELFEVRMLESAVAIGYFVYALAGERHPDGVKPLTDEEKTVLLYIDYMNGPYVAMSPDYRQVIGFMEALQTLKARDRMRYVIDRLAQKGLVEKYRPEGGEIVLTLTGLGKKVLGVTVTL